MIQKSLSLNQKLWLTISVAIVVTITFSYILMNLMYQNLYIDDVESSLIDEGLRLAEKYEGGAVSEALYEQVEWYDSISESEVFLVDNPKELSACMPFEIEHDSLISEKERLELLNGEVVVKDGFEERFDRNIMGVIIPLLDDKRLQGVIYLYMPLASVQEVLQEPRLLVIEGALVFFFIMIIIGRQIISRLTLPLEQMEKISYKMSQGDFSERVTIKSLDEVGRLGKAFNKMADALAEVDQSRKEFLANVSHELRTPISYVKGYSEAMIDGVVQTEEERLKYTNLIHREASRMQRLVRDLLDLAQMEGKSYPLTRVPLSLAQLIEETLEKYEPFLDEKDITLKTELDHGIIVKADQDRIEQVFQNILDNAIRYTNQGGDIIVKLKETSKLHCQIIISDSGPGISPEHLARIGERFYRVDKGRSRQYGGTGLGLAIVKKILYLHEGRLDIESEVGKGTDMIITLPLFSEGEEVK